MGQMLTADAELRADSMVVYCLHCSAVHSTGRRAWRLLINRGILAHPNQSRLSPTISTTCKLCHSFGVHFIDLVPCGSRLPEVLSVMR